MGHDAKLPGSSANSKGSFSAQGQERRAVVVLGMHRSGTSAIARVLSLLGLSLPRTPMGPSPGNELGHWGESERIRSVHNELLASAGSAWDDVLPFPHSWQHSPLADEYRSRMVEVVEAEYPGPAPFVLKDPRICRLVGFWISVLDQVGVRPAFVLPLRNPLEAAASLARRDGFTDSKGLLLWLRHVLDAERDTREQPRAFVTYDDVMRDWRSSAREISERIELSWPRAGPRAAAEIERFLSADQRHHDVSLDELNAREEVVEWVKETYALVLDACRSGESVDRGRLDELSAALADADLAYGPVLAESALRAEELRKRLESERARHEAELRSRDAKLSDVTAQLSEREAQLSSAGPEHARLEAELGKLTERLDASEATGAERAREIERLADRIEASEAKLLAATARLEERDAAELRGEVAALHRESRATHEAVDELRNSGLTRRAAAAWRRGRGRLAAGRRSLSQLGSWVLNPASQGRPRNVWELLVLRRSGRFDPEFYLRRSPDVYAARMNPLLHYIEHGARTGLDPSPAFSTSAYLAEHPELAASGVNPLYHFHRSSRRAKGALRAERSSATALPRPRALPSQAPAPEESPGEVSPQSIEAARGHLATKPLTVSVVVPTHNRAQELRRALSSAVEQSYPPLEIIVSDDGSTDETQAMLHQEYARELETGLVRYVRSERRRGPSAARNAGLEAARGDLIAYLDSDNAWEEHFLLLMAGTLAERDDAGAAYCGYNLRRDGDAPARQCFDRYDRAQLLARNYIDLNAFVHRRRIFDQLGGFDESMSRLVDWELILRYTLLYPPAAVPFYLVDYYAGEDGNRVTHTESFDENAAIVARRFAHERIYSGVSPLRIGYVLWDFPSLSQTFVLSEIRRLIETGYDVHVYYHATPDRAAHLDFEVPAFQVADADELAALLIAHERTMLHSHFAYPAVTRLTYPAAVAAGVPFTFMVHAVDIFHRANIERNRIAEITNHDLCLRVFGAGEHHRSFLIGRGVPAEKIAIARQASRHSLAPREMLERRLARPRRVIACIARFVEKKGVDDLIRAGALLGDRVEIRLYGYGPREQRYRELADELGAGCVRFAGVLEDARAVGAALEDADVFALPCVVDADGDMDGLPTVLGEAMAAGVPVVTTDVSSIPEIVRDGISGFVVPPRDPEALAAKLVEVAEMDSAALRPVIDQAQRLVSDVWNLERIVEALLDAWEHPPIDIALVTYSKDEDATAETTLEIIHRIYELTTTEFKLTIVDNGSDPEFTHALQGGIKGRTNAELILLDRNVFWGPAVNLAFRNAHSEFGIYVCSKEGFVLRPGWEREFLNYLRAHRDVAVAGHTVSSPAFPTASSYTRQPWFGGFRNKQFAELNPEREFSHVQGGLFAVRRTAFAQCGGFSEVVSQDRVDIEFSYLLESHGWELGEVDTIASLTKNTLPGIHAHLDENTVAAHPLSLESVELASSVASGRSAFCNVCAWSGDSFRVDGGTPDSCPRCGSTPFGRLLYRYLARSTLPYRNLDCAAVLDDGPVRAELERMFALTPIAPSGLERGLGSRDIVIADLGQLAEEEPAPNAIATIAGSVSNGGVAIIGPPLGAEGNGGGDVIESTFANAGFETIPVSVRSRAVRFAPGGLLVASRARKANDRLERAGVGDEH